MTILKMTHSIDDVSGLTLSHENYKRALTMIDSASDLVGDGEGREIGDNPEYERGITEMICEMCDIPMAYKDDVLTEIREHAVAKRDAIQKKAI